MTSVAGSSTTHPTQGPTYENLLIAIGGSAGGMEAMLPVFERLPDDFQAAIVIATHRAPHPENILAEIVQRHTALTVADTIDGEMLTCTKVYIGLPQETVEVEGRHLSIGIDEQHVRRMQRIDDLFVSVAESAGRNAVGVVLSGMLWDGVAGLKAIHEAGGYCIVQKPEDAEFDSMPTNAIAEVDVDFVGTSEEIAERLIQIAADRECH